jgi:hypothetical protein
MKLVLPCGMFCKWGKRKEEGQWWIGPRRVLCKDRIGSTYLNKNAGLRFIYQIFRKLEPNK